MNTLVRRAALVLAWLLVPVAQAAVVPDQGTWQRTLQARDLDGNPGDGAEAYYDTDLNVTWLRETSVDYGNSLGNPGGAVDAEQAQAWVASIELGGVDHWRLPATLPVNGTSFNYVESYDGSTDLGSWGTVSEMAQLFYVTLGNTGYCPYTDLTRCAGTLPVHTPIMGPTNAGPFENLAWAAYLSGTPYGLAPRYDAWVFEMAWGLQDYCYGCGPIGKNSDVPALFALAVHDGDVGTPISAVPEPPALVLLLAGTGVLVAARHRRQAVVEPVHEGG